RRPHHHRRGVPAHSPAPAGAARHHARRRTGRALAPHGPAPVRRLPRAVPRLAARRNRGYRPQRPAPSRKPHARPRRDSRRPGCRGLRPGNPGARHQRRPQQLHPLPGAGARRRGRACSAARQGVAVFLHLARARHAGPGAHAGS
nr:hypothetical protein [Tanacetum cinerariifolium]